MLSEEVAELFLGNVIKDHLPVQRPGNQVRVDERRVDGLEDAERPHDKSSHELKCSKDQQKFQDFAAADDLGR
jgi:hypothetical protein